MPEETVLLVVRYSWMTTLFTGVADRHGSSVGKAHVVSAVQPFTKAFWSGISCRMKAKALGQYTKSAFSVTALAQVASALGAVAIGAAAIGAFFIGALAIHKLRVMDTRLERLELGNIHIRHLSVESLNTPKD